jgi:hypothetical protein
MTTIIQHKRYSIAKKFLPDVNIAKLFENPDAPLRLRTVMADGKPVLEAIERPKEPFNHLD